MRSSVSIILFFLLSGFFLAALLGSTERSRKLLAIAGGCLVALACIIVFVKPVQLPPASQLIHGTSTTTSTTVPPGPPGAAGSSGVDSTTTPGTTPTGGSSQGDSAEVASVR